MRATCSARLAVEDRDAHDPEEMQAHRRDHEAGDEGDDRDVGAEKMHLVAGEAPDRVAEDAGGRAERDEDGREAEHEGKRRQHDVAPALVRRRLAEFLGRKPGHEAEVGRHERQHARRDEGQESPEESADDADIHHGREV